MNYQGDIRLGDTIDVKFCTVNTSGVPTTLAGTPVVSAYVGNGTTQITAGITLTVDFDSVTGLHNVRVVASSGNGFATATNVQLVITTGTVGGSSVVGYVIGSFSIEARSALMPTTAARTLDVSAGGEAGVDWANVGSPTTTVNLSGTSIATAAAVTTVNGLAANVITATSIASGAITAAKFAASAIDATAIAADAITAAKIAAGAITSAKFAASAIDATAIASNAFTSAKFAAGAFDAVWTVASRTLTAFALGVDVTSINGNAITANAGLNFAVFFANGAAVSGLILDDIALEASVQGVSTDLAAVQADVTQIIANLAAGVTVTTNNDKTGYAIGTGGIATTSFAAGAIDAAAFAQSAGQEIADEVLNRNLAGGGSGNTRNVRNALRALRNRVDGSTGTLSVYEEDDTTPAWTATLTRSAVNAIVEVNP